MRLVSWVLIVVFKVSEDLTYFCKFCLRYNNSNSISTNETA